MKEMKKIEEIDGSTEAIEWFDTYLEAPKTKEEQLKFLKDHKHPFDHFMDLAKYIEEDKLPIEIIDIIFTGIIESHNNYIRYNKELKRRIHTECNTDTVICKVFDELNEATKCLVTAITAVENTKKLVWSLKKHNCEDN